MNKKDFLKSLQGLIKINIKFDKLFSIKITRNTTIYNIGAGTSGVDYDKKSHVIHINPEQVPSKLKDGLKEFTQNKLSAGNPLIEDNTKKLLEKVKKTVKDNPNKGILEFYKDNIPSQDHEALEAAYYVKDLFESGEHISHLKHDISDRFGERGKNICNLCTSGYFDGLLKDLYNEDRVFFNELYEDIVGKSMIAVFIHLMMTEKQIMEEISDKLNVSKRYGLSIIWIHAIGQINIKKIKKCIEKQKEYFEFFEQPTYESPDKNIIIIKLILK